MIITETKHGFVCANSGIDSSNVPGEDMVCLLPLDSDRSARGIRKAIGDLKGGAQVGVVISDTFGRAWREGHSNFAIGVPTTTSFPSRRSAAPKLGSLGVVELPGPASLLHISCLFFELLAV